MSRSRLLGLVLTLCILLLTLYQQRQSQQSAPTPQPTSTANIATTTIATSSPLYLVNRVVDGDTVKIHEDGKIVTLRLIGIDTPEVVDPNKPVQCFGEEASDKAKQMLTGQSVRIEQDPSQGTLDKYGRTLAYIFLPDGTLFNEYMIEQGFGREYTYHNNPYKYQAQFKAAQSDAQQNKRGLWSACP